MFAFSSWRRSYGLILIATLAVVAAADFLIYGHTLGWTSALVAAAMLAALALRDTAFWRARGGRLCALAAVGLLFALIEQPTWLNVAYSIVCLGALAMTNALGWEPDFWPWVRRWGGWIAIGWAQVFLDNGLVVRWLMRRGFSFRSARGIAAWCVPVLLASVFVAIFAWANPIIADWMSRLGTWIGDLLARLPDLLNISRILFWLVFATAAWMLLRGRVRRLRARHPAGDSLYAEILDQDPERSPRAGIPVAFAVRCLILFNLVFAVENALDLRYLYSPNSSMPTGTEYKQYARRGAYPLVGAALLAGAFVLITFSPGSATEASNPARKLVYVWIGQTILLTVSAAWRLQKYVALTELTRLRVASAIWFALVALGLFYIVWRIVKKRSNGWLVNVNAVTALLVLYPCCFINFDGIMADFNVVHCAEAGGEGSPLDIEYLDTIGTAALPALDRARDPNHVALPTWRAELATKISDRLHQELAGDLSDWRSWTWRRSRSATPEDWAVAQTIASSPKPLLAQATTSVRSR
jgi:hypothetical protein